MVLPKANIAGSTSVLWLLSVLVSVSTLIRTSAFWAAAGSTKASTRASATGRAKIRLPREKSSKERVIEGVLGEKFNFRRGETWPPIASLTDGHPRTISDSLSAVDVKKISHCRPRLGPKAASQ